MTVEVTTITVESRVTIQGDVAELERRHGGKWCHHIFVTGASVVGTYSVPPYNVKVIDHEIANVGLAANRNEVDGFIACARRIGIDLNDMVRDACARMAQAVNNDGEWSQAAFLIGQGYGIEDAGFEEE